MDEQPQFEEKSIFLRNKETGEIIGLHEIGDSYEDDNGEAHWMRMESWANSYDKNLKFQASIFRIFGPIEETRDEILDDDEWEEFDTEAYKKQRALEKTREVWRN